MTLQAIKEAIEHLPEEEQLELESWLADRWDAQIEQDFTRNGALIKPKKLVGPDDETKNSAEYERQKQAFDAIPAKVLAQYHGQFVVSHNGQIVDSDLDLATLGRRFFGKNGDVPAYITKVGGPIEVRIRTPFVK